MTAVRNPVGWFEIYVQDMDRAKAFYEHVFQGKLTKHEPSTDMDMWVFPHTKEHETAYGAMGALVHMKDVASGGNSTLVYFGCQDCAVEVERVKQAGGKIYFDKTSIGENGHIALFFDTEGNMVGLHSMQ